MACTALTRGFPLLVQQPNSRQLQLLKMVKSAKHASKQFPDLFKNTSPQEHTVAQIMVGMTEFTEAEVREAVQLLWNYKEPNKRAADSEPDNSESSSDSEVSESEGQARSTEKRPGYRVPMPKSFSGKVTGDASVETWFDRVQRYCKRMKMNLLEAFWDFLIDKAAEWGQFHLKRHEDGTAPLTEASLRALFIKQFGDPNRNPSMQARDKLIRKEHEWQPQVDDWRTYTQRFLNLCRDIFDLTESEKILYYLSGLPSSLRSACAVDAQHKDWESYAALEDYVYGEVKIWKERQSRNKRGPELNLIDTSHRNSTQARKKHKGNDKGAKKGAGPSRSGRGPRTWTCWECKETFEDKPSLDKHTAAPPRNCMEKTLANAEKRAAAMKAKLGQK
uniref:Putative gag protein n=1 Tax=Chlamydomonas reinhardtii TaxID=3055 RepID=Q84UZ1_CHLRE|nr:putative gag protein [Chlamydomonas reinhardtii]